MKIAYIIHDYSTEGGIEKIVSQKANYLANYGYDVSIISFQVNRTTPFFFYDSRIKTYNLSLDSYRENKRNKIIFLTQLEKILNQIKPDITISSNMELGKYICSINDGSKKVLEYHFSKFKGKIKLSKLNTLRIGKIIPYLYMYKKTQLIKQFDRFVVLTQEDREQWNELKNNIEVIPNFSEFKESVKIDYSNKNIIGVGRYTGQKGWKYLIEVWSKLAHKYPDWTVSIFGHGHHREDFQVLVNRYKLERSFFLHDSTPEIAQEYAKSSIFVMTSRYEGLPMVLIEAMQLALPAITFKFKCGPKDLIKDGQTGYLVEQFDTEQFAKTLSKLMDNQELRAEIGIAAQKDIALKINKETIMNKWIQLLENLIVE